MTSKPSADVSPNPGTSEPRRLEVIDSWRALGCAVVGQAAKDIRASDDIAALDAFQFLALVAPSWLATFGIDDKPLWNYLVRLPEERKG